MTILIADDYPGILRGMCNYLVSRHYDVVSLCSNGNEAWENLLLLKPDIAMLDQNMPGMNGVQVAEKIYREKLGVKAILLTMHRERSLLDKAESIGINGYLLKDFALAEIDECLQTVHTGGYYYSKYLNDGKEESGTDLLSVAERKIARMMATGKSTVDIADIFSIPTSIVDMHKADIMRKLGLEACEGEMAIWTEKILKYK